MFLDLTMDRNVALNTTRILDKLRKRFRDGQLEAPQGIPFIACTGHRVEDRCRVRKHLVFGYMARDFVYDFASKHF